MESVNANVKKYKNLAGISKVKNTNKLENTTKTAETKTSAVTTESKDNVNYDLSSLLEDSVDDVKAKTYKAPTTAEIKKAILNEDSSLAVRVMFATDKISDKMNQMIQKVSAYMSNHWSDKNLKLEDVVKKIMNGDYSASDIAADKGTTSQSGNKVSDTNIKSALTKSAFNLNNGKMVVLFTFKSNSEVINKCISKVKALLDKDPSMTVSKAAEQVVKEYK